MRRRRCDPRPGRPRRLRRKRVGVHPCVVVSGVCAPYCCMHETQSLRPEKPCIIRRITLPSTSYRSQLPSSEARRVCGYCWRCKSGILPRPAWYRLEGGRSGRKVARHSNRCKEREGKRQTDAPKANTGARVPASPWALVRRTTGRVVVVSAAYAPVGRPGVPGTSI
ncbi:hypothetical protein OH77DRAFT_851605 [Trametes cingulata]|nr:hypothetical protein OH77DRAFT_851605 [Trametes cingulata]